MSLEQKLSVYWETEIIPRFSQLALEAKRELRDGTSVRYVNLDNAATTKPFKSVTEQAIRDLDEYGSVHRGAGQESKITTDKYERARETIRKFVGASPNSYVVFTKNTTEAINHAAALWSGINGKVLVSDIEHSSNLLPWLRTQEIIQYRTNEDGTVDVAEVEKVLSQNPEIKLLAITGASNVTGYKPPIHDLAQIAHRNGAKILVDVCQYLQHDKVDMLPDDNSRHLDFIAFSGHKMYAPFGAGVLVGPKVFFDGVMPYQIGGGNLPYLTSDLRISRFPTVQTHDPGTPNAIGALAIAKSIEELEEIGMDRLKDYEHGLVGLAIDELRKSTRVRLYVAVPHGSVIPFDVDGFPAKLVSEILAQEYGIGTRAGSFCTYELIRKVKGISSEEDARIAKEVNSGITTNIPSVARASFSIYNRLEDVKRFVKAVNLISTHGFQHYSESYIMDAQTGDWSPR